MAEALLGVDALAGELGVPISTIYAWRHRGLGPRGYKVGKYVRYRRADIEAWLELQADPRPVPA